MEPTQETPVEVQNVPTEPVDTTLTVTSGTPLEEAPEPTVPDAPVTEGAILTPNVEPVKVMSALMTAHTLLVAVLESAVKNTEVATVEGVDTLIKGVEDAKDWLVSEVRKYDPATADELAAK